MININEQVFSLRTFYQLFFLVVFIFFSVSNVTAATKNPEEYFFDETFGDFSEELESAKEQGKRGVLVFFEMDDCPFCQWMKSNVLNQTRVQDYFKEHFLIFTVDIEGDIAMTNFQGKETTQKDFSFKENRVRATPVIAFFNTQGKRVLRYTGRTSSADEFLLMGQYVVNEEYKNSKFSRYKRNHRKK